jgi:hypothetical protein
VLHFFPKTQRIAATTIDELKEVLIRAWDSISQKAMTRLCASCEARLRICLEIEGDSTSKHLWLCCDRAALAAWKINQDSPHLTWTPEEDSQLDSLVRTIGFKWKSIAPMMTGRTANQIKNRWYSMEQPAGDEQSQKIECKLNQDK